MHLFRYCLLPCISSTLIYGEFDYDKCFWVVKNDNLCNASNIYWISYLEKKGDFHIWFQSEARHNLSSFFLYWAPLCWGYCLLFFCSYMYILLFFSIVDLLWDYVSNQLKVSKFFIINIDFIFSCYHFFSIVYLVCMTQSLWYILSLQYDIQNIELDFWMGNAFALFSKMQKQKKNEHNGNE